MNVEEDRKDAKIVEAWEEEMESFGFLFPVCTVGNVYTTYWVYMYTFTSGKS